MKKKTKQKKMHKMEHWLSPCRSEESQEHKRRGRGGRLKVEECRQSERREGTRGELAKEKSPEVV